jgi:hypothetical protein
MPTSPFCQASSLHFKFHPSFTQTNNPRPVTHKPEIHRSEAKKPSTTRIELTDTTSQKENFPTTRINWKT